MRIVDSGYKIDLHIHSVYSKGKDKGKSFADSKLKETAIAAKQEQSNHSYKLNGQMFPLVFLMHDGNGENRRDQNGKGHDKAHIRCRRIVQRQITRYVRQRAADAWRQPHLNRRMPEVMDEAFAR